MRPPEGTHKKNDKKDKDKKKKSANSYVNVAASCIQSQPILERASFNPAANVPSLESDGDDDECYSERSMQVMKKLSSLSQEARGMHSSDASRAECIARISRCMSQLTQCWSDEPVPPLATSVIETAAKVITGIGVNHCHPQRLDWLAVQWCALVA